MFGANSIAKRLTWMNMLVSATALLLACAAFIGYDLVTFREGTVYNISIQAQIAGSNAVSALLFDDQDSAVNTLSALKASPAIISAGILGPDGQTFATYSRDGKTHKVDLPPISPGQIEAHRFGAGSVLLVRSIIFKGAPAGTVYIESDLQRLNARLKRYAGISLVVLGVSLLVALLMSTVSRRSISEPITHLSEIARIVSRDKNYSVRADFTGAQDELSTLVNSFNGMLAQIQERDTALEHARDELEQRVAERTTELATINGELESFSYSVSHDLRAPLRSIDGFSQALAEDYGDKLDSAGLDHLQRVRRAAQHMSGLIDDMLSLSRVTRSTMRKEKLDLSALARSVAEELQREQPERRVEFLIADGLTVEGDSQLLRIALENLLGNAWKYTSRHERARIEVGRHSSNGHAVLFVKDDGAGFDQKYSERLFGAFQRLHGVKEFPGTGIGLATVQRIIRRHGGTIWAEGAVEKGATFYFTV
jgi:signal transduction histidine kinase